MWWQALIVLAQGATAGVPFWALLWAIDRLSREPAPTAATSRRDSIPETDSREPPLNKPTAPRRRAAASASARAARIARAPLGLRAAKGGPSGGGMVHAGFGGQGQYGGWRYLAPGSEYDHEAMAGDLWRNATIASSLGWLKRNFAEPTLEVVRELDADDDTRPAARADGTKGKAGSIEVVADSPLVALLNRPNPFYDRHTFWAACLLSGVVDGNSYIRKVRDRRDNVIQLWWLPHWTVWPRWAPDGSEFVGWYEREVNGHFERIEVRDIIHFRNGVDPRDDRRGFSEVKTAVRQVCGLNDCDTYTAAIMRNMGVPGVLVSSAAADGVVDEVEMEVFTRQWRENFTSEGRGSAMIFPRPMRVEQVSFSPEQLALDRIPARLEAAICAAIGVPAMVVGLAAGAEFKTYSNFIEARKAAYQDCLVPMQKQWADVLTHQILQVDFDPDARCRWDYSTVQCLQDDETAAADRVGKLYQTYQVLMRSEARAALGYDSTEQDEVYYPEAMLRYRDHEDFLADDDRPDGPNKIGGAGAKGDAEQIPIDADAATALNRPGGTSSQKISEPLDHKIVGEAIGADGGGAAGRSAPGDAETRAMSPAKLHKASEATAILAHALKGRGWTGQHRDDTLTFDQRHDVLADISAYATDWLRHEATGFFAENGADDDRGQNPPHDRGDDGAHRRGDDLGDVPGAHPEGDGRTPVSVGEEAGAPTDAAGHAARSIDPAAAIALRNLFRRCKQFVREANLAGAMALAGPARLTADDLAAVEQVSDAQDRFFDNFLAELLAAPPGSLEASRAWGVVPSPGQVIGRMGQYGSGIWGGLVNWWRKKFGRKPPPPGTIIQERRRLNPVRTEHCSECPGLADLGWQPIGTLPGVGECECYANDACSFEYREVPAGTPAGPDG